MKREYLTSLGLDVEKVDAIMVEHGKSVNALKAKQTDYETQIADLKGQISDRDNQLKDLNKSAGDNDALKEQISKLQDENKKSNEAYEAKIQKLAVDNAIDLALTNAGAKNIKAARALLNLEGTKMEGERVIGLSEQIAKVKESDPYMFNDAKPIIKGAQPAQGSGTPAPSAQPGSYEAFAQSQGLNL